MISLKTFIWRTWSSSSWGQVNVATGSGEASPFAATMNAVAAPWGLQPPPHSACLLLSVLSTVSEPVSTSAVEWGLPRTARGHTARRWERQDATTGLGGPPSPPA